MEVLVLAVCVCVCVLTNHRDALGVDDATAKEISTSVEIANVRPNQS